MVAEVPQLYRTFKTLPEVPGVSIYGERRGEVAPGYAYAYSGHGNQVAGEVKKLIAASPKVRDAFRVAADALAVFNYDFERVVDEGTQETLNRTEHAHPYILFGNVACEIIMSEADEKFANGPSVVVGPSLGFGNAVHRAGVLGPYGSPEALSRLMRIGWYRGQINQMLADQMEYEEQGSGLVWRGVRDDMTRSKVARFMKENEVLEVKHGLKPAIVNHVGERVYGGYRRDIEAALQDPAIKDSTDSLSMFQDTSSVAFHTDLMVPVDKPLKEGILTIPFADAKIPVVSNTKVPAVLLIDGETIREELFALSPQPVRGDAQADLLYELGFSPQDIAAMGKKGMFIRSIFRNPQFLALAAVLGGVAATAVVVGGLRVAQIGAKK